MFTLSISYFQRAFRRNLIVLGSSLLLAATATAAGGCGGDDDDDNTGAPGRAGAPGGAGSAGNAGGAGPVEDGCARGAIEADLGGADGKPLAGQTPLQGPGVDAATGQLKAGSYVFSSTYLRMPPDERAQTRFLELTGPVVNDLTSQPGLVAFALALAPACSSARTLTVWESEEAMFQFAATASHRTAAAASDEVSRGGSAVTHWSGDAADGTWAKSAAELATTPAFD